MPDRDKANPDAPDKQHRLAYSSLAFLSPQYLTWTAPSGVAAGPFLTLPDGLAIMVLSVLGYCFPSHGSFAN
jgi:hypothetical protein